jgi:GNAT superfamily N-acetyltransferase
VRIRIADPDDIPELIRVRMSVRENVLSSPTKITRDDYIGNLCTHGRGWVAEAGDAVVAFASGRHSDGNIWALFVDPQFERRGIGGRLHDTMVEWLFAQGVPRLWLSTGSGTRAEQFYMRRGWTPWPPHPAGEQRLVLVR